MAAATQLIDKNVTYVIDADDQIEVLTQIAGKLADQGLVTDGFLPSLLNRERDYPTGMDMSIVDPEFPNFAVPHTEPEYVVEQHIVPVSLVRPVEWHNMIDPSQTMEVSFLFMILNPDGAAQTGLLARIMDFANEQGAQRAKAFFALNDVEKIHTYLMENFPG